MISFRVWGGRKDKSFKKLINKGFGDKNDSQLFLRQLAPKPFVVDFLDEPSRPLEKNKIPQIKFNNFLN